MGESVVQQAGEAPGHNEQLRLIRDGVVNSSAYLVSGMIGIFLIPIMLGRLGSELFGLWVAALSVAAVLGVLEFELKASLIREVGASNGRTFEQTARFVNTASKAYLLVGLVGAVIIASFGLPLSGNLHLSAESAGVAPTVFGLVGVAFLADQRIVFATAVLSGMRRFGTINAISSGAAFVRASGIIALLVSGAGLVSIAIWYALTSAFTAYAAHAILCRLEPQFFAHATRFSWRTLYVHMPFSFLSLLTTVATKITWESAPVLIGLLCGAVCITPYSVGQKFPLVAANLYGRASQVLFPVASKSDRTGDTAGFRFALQTGTRWIVVSVLPICLMLWILSSNLLQAWLGEARPDTVLVLRITAATLFGEALGACALQLLWGSGRVEKVLWLMIPVMVSNLGLCFWLVLKLGIAGAAWALCLPVTLASMTLLWLASRAFGTGTGTLMLVAFRGLLLPSTTCAVTAIAIAYFGQPNQWPGVFLAVLASGATYFATFYLKGAREEERLLIRDVLRTLGSFILQVYRGLRRNLRRFTFLRSIYHLMLALIDLVRDPWRSALPFDRQFAIRVDPWNYSSPAEQNRHQLAVQMLDSVRNGVPFGRALEVGCAEGMFTRLLAKRCQSLLAVDFSHVALSRARQRCHSHSHVQFEQWDLRSSSLRSTFDLIVVMDVLSHFVRPTALHSAVRELLGGLALGGYLFVCDVRQSEIFENAWWGRHLIRGGKRIVASLATYPELQVVETANTGTHVLSLFRKLR